MKKSLVLLALALATASAASAQTKMAPVKPGQNMPGKGHGHHDKNKTPEQRAAHQTERLGKELGLRADQKAKVQEVLLAQGRDSKAIKEKYVTPDQRRAMAEEMKASRAKYDAQLKQVLDADQYSKLMAQRAERRDKMKADHDGKGKVKIKG